MKFLYLSSLFFLSFFVATSQVENSNKFLLRGSFAGLNTEVIKISYFDKNHVWIDDTATIDKNSFTFRGLIDEPTRTLIYGNTKSRALDDPNMIEVFIEPGTTVINLNEDDFKNAKIQGSHSQMLLEELKKLKMPIEESSKEIANAYEKTKEAYSKGDTSKITVNRMENLRLQLIPFHNKMKDVDLNFIQNHSDEYVSSYLLGFYSTSLSRDSLRFYYDTLSNRLKNNRYGQKISTALMPEKQTTAVVGAYAPNFNMRDIDAKWISLKSYKSKNYVLLDFWASWCGPCIKMNPHLHKFQKNYSNKGLQIISLSLDHDKEKWEKAVKKEHLNAWKNILIGQNGEAFDFMRENYDLITIPMYMLIDKNGKILGRYDKISQDSQLTKILKEIF